MISYQTVKYKTSVVGRVASYQLDGLECPVELQILSHIWSGSNRSVGGILCPSATVFVYLTRRSLHFAHPQFAGNSIANNVKIFLKALQT